MGFANIKHCDATNKQDIKVLSHYIGLSNFPTLHDMYLLTNGISTQHISIVAVNNNNIIIKSSNINLDSTNLIGL